MESLAKFRARTWIALIDGLAQQASEFATMDYEFLFDKVRNLLSIGYNVGEHRLDSSYYDLLASEARLCSFVAIAQGQLPQENWFALGRTLTSSGGAPTLISWSGSMFEYLMPLLVMPTTSTRCSTRPARRRWRGRSSMETRAACRGASPNPATTPSTLISTISTARLACPAWGSNAVSAEDLVIAPYASALALMVAPEEACLNLQRLAADGFEARYGFYEAIDYTPSRLPRGQTSAVVRSFMAHHQGMSFLSLAYLLLDRPMQKRFESDPLFQATTLLLQERALRATRFHFRLGDLSDVRKSADEAGAPRFAFSTPRTRRRPKVQLLSNGRYHVMVTNAGGGYSRWKDLAVTRWREDSTCDNWGTFCYIRDVASGEFWSTAYQPTLKRADNYEAIFSEGRAEFRRRDARPRHPYRDRGFAGRRHRAAPGHHY